MTAMQKERILIVDDSEMNRSILADILYGEFEITEAENGIQALSILQEESGKFSLVLLDIVMPEMDGFGVLAEMNRLNLIDNLPVIMVSAETASSQIERAYELGATDFIMRPFDASIVHRRVVNTILLYAKQKKLISIIEDQIDEKERVNSLMVDILSHIVEFRNGESGLHIQHVRVLTNFLLTKVCEKTDRYPLSETDISIISIASALHDIGKIGIDDHILNKPGPLTDEEYKIMKTHSTIGARILDSLTMYKDNPLVRRAYEICRWHHERYDGKGYPDGLSGDKIPIGAQIVALADVYDALTSERVYKKAFSHEKAVEMILEGKCGAFNPLLLKCLAENGEAIRNILAKPTEKVLRRELRGFTDALAHTKAGEVASDRTLRLLDYERMKYNFFAAMTEEIQFEYSVATDTMTISPLGAKKLGVEEVVVSPENSEKLKEIIGGDWFKTLIATLEKSTPEKPEIRYEKQLHCNGEYRWHNIIVRAIWTDEIPPKVDGFIGKAVDVHDAHITITELKENATHDPLTDLLNRAEARAQIERRLLNYPNHKYALACFDIDFFKQANDTYGHLFGDKVLKSISQRMTRSIRASDICARMGGDEFLIFFEYDTDINPIIARIFKSLCCSVDKFDVTISMGVAEMNVVGESYEELFHRADLALYHSKQSGRNQYHLYDDSMKDVLPESNLTAIDAPVGDENKED